MLATVKGLTPVLERALAGASGVNAEALRLLRAALPHVDHPVPEHRKAALRRVVAGLKLGGVVLPVELEGLAEEPPAASPLGREPGARGGGGEPGRDGASPRPRSAEPRGAVGTNASELSAPDARGAMPRSAVMGGGQGGAAPGAQGARPTAPRVDAGAASGRALGTPDVHAEASRAPRQQQDAMFDGPHAAAGSSSASARAPRANAETSRAPRQQQDAMFDGAHAAAGSSSARAPRPNAETSRAPRQQQDAMFDGAHAAAGSSSARAPRPNAEMSKAPRQQQGAGFEGPRTAAGSSSAREPRARGMEGQLEPSARGRALGTDSVAPPPGYVQMPSWRSSEPAPAAPRAKDADPRSGASSARGDGQSYGAHAGLTRPAASPPARGGEPRPAGRGARQASLDTGPESKAPAKARKEQKKKKRAVAAEASRSEAKLLSIAPRSGPLSSPLKTLGKRLGPRLISALDKKGLRRMGDILFLLPRCYEDRRRLLTIAELEPGERGVTVGMVKVADFVPGKQGRRMFRAVVGDSSGSIAATYFNAGPWLKSRFTVGKRLVLSGEVRATMSGREMAHPEIEPAEDLDSATSVHFNRIVPVYPGFERGEQRSFRELASRVGEQYAHALEDPLPPELRRRLELMGLPDALRFIHFPPEDADLEALDAHQSPAHRRLAFDELFFLQLGMALKRQGIKAEQGISFDVSPAFLEKARTALPFQLTGAQARVVEELSRDMARAEPMNRLVQGDVGSGKTAVAMVSALVALQNGYQVAVMAPTEILAEQHERNFRKVLGPLGFQVGLVSASGTAKAKRQVRDAVARGDIHLAVGTHALIQQEIAFDRLGLVVIDEQHRFGVLQRHTLMSKGLKPDVLVMTATPIPRTLAMTLYGDLDLSIIDQLPPGRTPINTRVFNDKQRARVYESIAAELAKGHQAYVVYPLVEESEKLDLEDATRGVEKLSKVFPEARVGLLHGRMKAEEKDAVMEEFREKRIQVLVCTTVVEVGVDVPNASVMVVESAERFGLSQLHQLRGRVGRGAAASHCYLVAGSARSWESAERLAVMEQSSDGFVIAEKDLEIRGPGEFLGTRQSGLPELAVANLARDGDLLSMAQAEARRILARDPEMKSPEHLALVKALEERWEGRLALAQVG
ncbi:ATP-dependent DNA helicase RecG [Myxococcus stipitatus]|nr:ATP-dependent DNA helicase RecG [Myxococcus stipitatus]